MFNGKGAKWVTAALFSFAWLGYLLPAVTMTVTKHSMSAAVVSAENVLAMIIAVVFLTFAAGAFREKPAKDCIKALPRSAGWVLWLIAVMLLSDFLADKVNIFSITHFLAEKPSMVMVIYCIYCAVICLVSGFILVKLTVSLSGDRLSASGYPVCTLLCAAGTAILTFLPLPVSRLFALIPREFNSAFTNFAVLAVCAVISSFAFIPAIYGICRKRETADENAEGTPVKKSFGIIPLITGAVILACSIALPIVTKPMNPVTQVKAHISGMISQAELDGAAGNFLLAAGEADRAQALIDAYKTAVLGKEDKFLKNAAVNYPLEEEVQFLYAVHFNDFRYIENDVLGDPEYSDDLMIALLDSYQGKDSPYKGDLVRILVRRGVFVNDLAYPDALKGYEDRFAEMLGQQEQRVAGLQKNKILANSMILGTGSFDYVKYLLSEAEMYPDDIDLQYMALNAGTGYQTDYGTHYDATVNAAKRYLALLKNENLSDEEYMNASLSVAGRLMLINRLADAVEITKGYTDKSEYAANMYVSYLYRQNDYEKCMAEAEKALKKWPDDRQMIYQRGLCALNLKDYDSYIDTILSVSQTLRSAADQDKVSKYDNTLYLLLEHAVLNDTSLYRTSCYSPEGKYGITPEQVERIAEDSFLKDYIDALYHWRDSNRKQSLECIDRVLAVNNDLPFAHYHRGMLCYESIDSGSDALAKAEFKTALSFDDKQPTVWYMLACTCDKLGEYQEAYDACLKVEELLPDSDHDMDAFGVGIHASNLRRKLADVLKEVK